MWKLLQQMSASWAQWVGDRDLEIALRNHLDQLGYNGRTARLRHVRLSAIQRPGWLQVYTFTVQFPSSTSPQSLPELFGVVRLDERYDKVEVGIFDNRAERTRQFDAWSHDLLRLRRPVS